MSVHTAHPHRRRGAVAVLVVAVAVVVLGFAALTIDVGHLYNARGELQVAADAAALAGVSQLPDELAAMDVAQQFATHNSPGHGTVLAVSDVQVGYWDSESALFTQSANPLNAVRVITRRADVNGNPVELFFAGIFGVSESDVSVGAIALLGSPGTSPFPFSLKRPGVGPVDPGQPFKPGPSEPANGEYFEFGEEVILGFNGKGHAGGNNIVLQVAPDNEMADIITGDAELAGDPMPTLEIPDARINAGIAGHWSKKLAKRLNYPDDHFLRDVVMPVVELIPGESRDSDTGVINGEVRIADFAAVHILEMRKWIATDPETGDTSEVEAVIGVITGITGQFAPDGVDLGTASLAPKPAQLVQ